MLCTIVVQRLSIAFTIVVDLACTIDGEEILTSVLFVRAESAFGTFLGDGRGGEVAEREVVVAVAAEGVCQVIDTVGHSVAVGLEVEDAVLELMMGGAECVLVFDQCYLS